MTIRKGWFYDYDNVWRDNEQTVCVAKDNPKPKPWGAYHTKTDGIGNPDSWHCTSIEAMVACEKAKQASNKDKNNASQ